MSKDKRKLKAMQWLNLYYGRPKRPSAQGIVNVVPFDDYHSIVTLVSGDNFQFAWQDTNIIIHGSEHHIREVNSITEMIISTPYMDFEGVPYKYYQNQ